MNSAKCAIVDRGGCGNLVPLVYGGTLWREPSPEFERRILAACIVDLRERLIAARDEAARLLAAGEAAAEGMR